MSVSRNKYLFKNTLIFAVGNFATKILSFLLVPLYTNVLSTEEFGTVDLLYTVCSFLVPLFSFNISEAVLRYSLDKKNNENKIMSIAFVSILFMFVSSILTIPILSFFSDFSKYKILFYIYLVTFGTSQIFLNNLKGQEKLKLYSLGNFIYALSVSCFNILFLLFFNLGINGYFIAYIISNIIIIIFGILFGNVLKNIKNFNFDVSLFKDMLKYSLVLIPTTFMWWIMNFLDRVMITDLISLSANGIYAVSYKIPTVLSVISSIFTQAWLFSAIKEKDSIDNVSYTNNVFKFLSFGIIFVGCCLLVIIKPLFMIYVSEDYFIAWKYVPYLMLGYIFLNLSTFISTSYNVHKDSKGHLFSAMFGAIINLILNFILIPLVGIHGAAIATLISYIAVFIYRIIDTRKYLIINLNWKFFISILLVIILSCLLYIQNILIFIIQLFIIFIILYLYKDCWKVILYSFINKLRKQ